MFKMDNSFMKIFRPWDNASVVQINVEEQDSTISTTSQEELEKYDSASSSESCDSPIVVSRKSNFSFAFTENTSYQNKHKTENNQHTKNSTISKTNKDSYENKETAKTKQIKPKSIKSYESTAKPNASSQVEFPLSQFDPYPIYPDIVHANLAQSLGLNPSDPLFMESVAQGYAMEEYARIISQEQQTKILNGRKQRPKKYKCPHCDVGFSNNGQLKGHIRIHTGERPFRCDEENCGKTFTRNEELTRHKRIHSGLRPFPCNQCGKRFGRKDHLKKHTRTHMQHRGVYAVPVMLHPMDAWAPSPTGYPYIPLYGY